MTDDTLENILKDEEGMKERLETISFCNNKRN